MTKLMKCILMNIMPLGLFAGLYYLWASLQKTHRVACRQSNFFDKLKNGKTEVNKSFQTKTKRKLQQHKKMIRLHTRDDIRETDKQHHSIMVASEAEAVGCPISDQQQSEHLDCQTDVVIAYQHTYRHICVFVLSSGSPHLAGHDKSTKMLQFEQLLSAS